MTTPLEDQATELIADDGWIDAGLGALVRRDVIDAVYPFSGENNSIFSVPLAGVVKSVLVTPTSVLPAYLTARTMRARINGALADD